MMSQKIAFPDPSIIALKPVRRRLRFESIYGKFVLAYALEDSYSPSDGCVVRFEEASLLSTYYHKRPSTNPGGLGVDLGSARSTLRHEQRKIIISTGLCCGPLVPRVSA